MALTIIFFLVSCSVVCLISAKDDLVTGLGETPEEIVNQTQQQQNAVTHQSTNLTTQTKASLNSSNGHEQKVNLRTGGHDPELKIAFSASLAESDGIFVGPSTTNTLTLVFKTVFINTGNAYDPNTGIFTAPVEGAYHFTISTFGYNTYTSGAILVKNGNLQVSTYEFQGPDSSDSSSNTVILPLDVGDQVKVILWSNGQVYDNANHHTTFSGFLLFQL